MNRTEKFALNATTSMISQAVVLIAGLITPRLMIATYGSEINGLVSSLNQFISYLSLVEAGIGGAAIYSLYKPIAEKNHSRISGIVVAARKSYTQAGYLFSAGLFALAAIYGIFASRGNLDFWTVFILALLLGSNGCIDMFLVSGYRVLLTADQRNYVIQIAGIINTIIRTGLIVVLTLKDVNVVLLFLIVSFSPIIKAILILLYSRKQYGFLDKSASPDKTALNKRYDVIYQQILGMIQVGAPTILATILLNLVVVSIYSVYNMVITGINGILGIFISGLPAGFGDMIAKNESENLKKTVSEFEVIYYWILSVIYGLTLVLIMPFISLYTKGISEVNYYYPILGLVIVLNGLLYNIKTPQSMLIVSAGMYKETRWRVTIQALIIIVASTLFGIKFGMIGILLGSCVSNLYRIIDMLIYVPKNITHLPARSTIKRMFIVLINISVIFLPSFFFMPVMDNYAQWIGIALLYAIYAIVITTISSYIFDKKLFKVSLSRVKNMINHERKH